MNAATQNVNVLPPPKKHQQWRSILGVGNEKQWHCSALHKLPGINFNFYATQKLQKQPEFPTRVGAIQNQK